MKLRIEQSKDVQMISLLNEPVQQWHHQHYPELFKAFNPTDVGAALREILNQPSAYAWVALMDEKPVGYALCIQQYRTENAFQYASTWLQLDQIGILPEYQQRGIGRALLHTIEVWCATENIHRIELTHWHLNSTASAFFIQNGFSVLQQRLSKKISP